MATAVEHPLARYRHKRDFSRTTEPNGEDAANSSSHAFVVQKHAASRLHYDFRLEMNGVLVSWALPKGPSFDPTDKRIAVHVEDHPLGYGSFEGVIPPKQYGAGSVIVWDHGIWEPQGDPVRSLAAGKVLFKLHGQKLAGSWELVRIAKPGDKQDLWILFKKRDAFARPKSEYDVLRSLPDSVISRPLARVASSQRGEPRAGEERHAVQGWRACHGPVAGVSPYEGRFTRLRSRRVTSSSETVGWMPTVASSCAFVTPQVMAIENTPTISAASSPTTWSPRTRSLATSTTSLIEVRPSRPLRLLLRSGRKDVTKTSISARAASAATAAASVSPTRATSGRLNTAVAIRA